MKKAEYLLIFAERHKNLGGKYIKMYCCNDEKDKYVGNIFIENDIEVNKRCLTHY